MLINTRNNACFSFSVLQIYFMHNTFKLTIHPTNVYIYEFRAVQCVLKLLPSVQKCLNFSVWFHVDIIAEFSVRASKAAYSLSSPSVKLTDFKGKKNNILPFCQSPPFLLLKLWYTHISAQLKVNVTYSHPALLMYRCMNVYLKIKNRLLYIKQSCYALPWGHNHWP